MRRGSKAAVLSEGGDRHRGSSLLAHSGSQLRLLAALLTCGRQCKHKH